MRAMKGRRQGMRRAMPLGLLVLAAFLATFCAGMYVGWSRVFPFDFISAAHKTLTVNLQSIGFGTGTNADRRAMSASPECIPVPSETRGLIGIRTLKPKCAAAHIAAADAAASRIEFVAGSELIDPLLVKGEVGTFLDHCPGPWGCLAVEYSRSGSVTRAWPFRPEDIMRANIVAESEYPYEHPLGWGASHLWVTGTALYPNGDMLVILNFQQSHPYGGGVARVGPDGKPRWYRKDYSHHRGYVASDKFTLVPGMVEKRSQHLLVPINDGKTIACEHQVTLVDTVNVLGRDGSLLEQIRILDHIVESPYATAILDASPQCIRTHLNFVHMLGANAGGADGMAPGDLVVSLRDLDAFAILDKDDRRLKKLVRGSFRGQHGVRHLDNARFIMYDNWGTDGVHGPSRLLIVDLATGKETTVFPNDATPAHLANWFTRIEGQFDISPDGRRAVVSDVFAGRAFEVRLADGQVLNVFRQIHDLSSLPGVSEELTETPWFFPLRGIYYANRWAKRDALAEPDL